MRFGLFSVKRLRNPRLSSGRQALRWAHFGLIPPPDIAGQAPASQVLILPGFLDAAFCERVRIAMGRGTSEFAEVLHEDFLVDDEARRAAMIEIDAATMAVVESRLEAARDELANKSGLALGAREGVSFVRYGAGGFYRRHRDRAIGSCWPEAAERVLSVVLFLNNSKTHAGAGEFVGGELLIFAETPAGHPIHIVPRRGLLVAFPSSAPHEVLPVRAGIRDVIVDWFTQSG